MKNLDAGKLGHGYVALLWLSLTLLALIGTVIWILDRTSGSPTATLRDLSVLLGVASVFGIAAWGVFRKQLWSYYFSLLISGDLIVSSWYDFFARPLTIPYWAPAILLVLGVVALAWLVSAAFRAQFPPGFRQKKVVGAS